MLPLTQQALPPLEGDVFRSTLLMLVMTVNEFTDSPEETVDVVHELLDTNRVQLTGNFRGTRLRRDA